MTEPPVPCPVCAGAGGAVWREMPVPAEPQPFVPGKWVCPRGHQPGPYTWYLAGVPLLQIPNPPWLRQETR